MSRRTWPIAALAAVLGSAVLGGTAQAAQSTWQCRASAVSTSVSGNPLIDPVTANASPCVANATGADGVPPGAGIPSNTLSAGTLSAITLANPANEIPARQTVGAIGRVENLGLTLPPGSGTQVLGVREAEAHAAGTCIAGTPVLDGGSTVEGVSLGGQVIPVAQLAQELTAALAPLGQVVDLRLDEQLREGASLTVRALHLRVLTATGTPVIDLIAGEARIASTGAVCNPNGQVAGSGSRGGAASSSGSATSLTNGVRGSTSCARLSMHFAKNKKRSMTSRYGRRAVVRGRLTTCKGKSIVRARIDVVHVIHGKRHLVKTGLRSRAGGQLTLILPSNLKTRDVRFEYRGNLLSKKVTSRSTLHISVRNARGKVVR
jgi:hypothetical protein